ncbi:MAG: hypothetical protein QOF21_3074 [Actinomycetota bacterium]|jgi:hypothetical protein
MDAGSLIDAMTDDELLAVVDPAPVGGWGTSSSVALPGGTTAFLKRLPLTAVEHARPYSTRNHFALPTYYQYGVGSAGFGAWRELATHMTLSDGVPALLHHRVMPAVAPAASDGAVHPRSSMDLDAYVAYWNGSAAVREYISARQSASSELWLFMEHVPHRLFDWIRENQSSTVGFVEELLATIRSLHANGVFHFDAHFGNVVTDGTRPLLTDFGLATSLAFDLADDERAFIDAHRHYDFGEVIYGVGNALLDLLTHAPEGFTAKHNLDRFTDHDQIVEHLVNNLDVVATDLGVNADYVAMVERFRPVILFMTAFFSTLRADPRKDTYFDDDRLASLLRDAGVVTA